MVIFITLGAHWFASLFSQSFFLHRYCAHRMFSMSKGWERFWFIFAYCTQNVSYLNPRAYAILHRQHHAFSDTEKDPHSPHNHSNVFELMWATRRKYIDIVEHKVAVEPRFEGGYPTWPALEKWGERRISRYIWGVAFIGFYAAMGAAWWMYFFLPIHFLMGPIHGAIVNYLGHKLGYQNFQNGDKSRNTVPMDILMLGELFQNNHHKYGGRPNFAVKWFEFDPVYAAMVVMDKIGMIKLHKIRRRKQLREVLKNRAANTHTLGNPQPTAKAEHVLPA